MGGFSSYIVEQENVKKQQIKEEVVPSEEKIVKKPSKKPVEQKPAEVIETTKEEQ